MMKGLLIKDIYTLTKQLKFFLLMFAVLSLMPGYSMSAFAVCYSALLPITALAYDERSKWDKLAAMLPYSAESIVLSKYILGYMCILAAALLSAAGKAGYAFYTKTPVGTDMFLELASITCVGILLQAINFPLIFRLGVEKGRLLFMVLTAALIAAYFIFSEKGITGSIGMDVTGFLAIMVAAAVIASIVSIPISVLVYKRRDI
ncbi:MAG: ABC-2 transporter permease [Oscillospiraceae bacterium]